MPYDFTRAWLNLDRVFRPTGDFRLPSKLSDRVAITYDALARVFTSGSQMRSSRQDVAMGAGANAATIPEATVGMITYPIFLTIQNPDAAARIISTTIRTTSTATDPWGRYADLLVTDQKSVDAGGIERFVIPSLPRGNEISIGWTGMTGGNNAAVMAVWVEIPGELFLLDDLAHMTGS